MKTREEAHKTLDAWVDGDCVGNLIIYRAPHAGYVDCICEQTIKFREMTPEQQDAFAEFLRAFDAPKGEFWVDRDGNPDRVKLTKGF